MARKKAWNMSNPLYRYLHRGGKRKKHSRGGGVARYRKRGRGRRSGGLLMRGMLGPKVGMGILGAAAVGFVAATLAKSTAPQMVGNIPYGEHVVAGAAGGLPGVAGNVIGKMLMGGTLGGNSGSTNPYA